jgi:hypothetical protein
MIEKVRRAEGVRARRLSGSASIEAVNTEKQKLGMFAQGEGEGWQERRD